MTKSGVNKKINSKGYFEDTQFENILRLFDISPIFPSPQVKRWEIISFKHGKYELPHELLKYFRN